MMTIGGINAALTGEKMWGGGDTTVRGIAFYDVTELAWTNTFSPRAPRYNRPAVVRNWYEEKYVGIDLALESAWSDFGRQRAIS